jgi:phage replication O-like protein O
MTKILAPNVTYVPNIIFDYWLNRLSPAEFKVLLAICRKTFGWHKVQDKISLTQLEKLTGLSRKGIEKSLKILEKHGLIEKEKSKCPHGGNGVNKYVINVYSVTNEEDQGRELSTLGVGNSGNQGRELSTVTKETITKEIDISKDISNTSDISLDISKNLHSSIVSWKKSLNKNSTPQKWQPDIDKMLRIDGRTEKQINEVIDWLKAGADDGSMFWRKIILSGEKLRKKFDQIEASMLSKPSLTKKDLIEKNKRILHEKFAHLEGKIIRGRTVLIHPDSIEFLSGGAANITNFIACSEKNFEAKVKEFL